MEKKTMRAVVRSGDPKKMVEVQNVPYPTISSEEVLIKVAASPINPSDEYFAKGIYGLKDELILEPPFIPGFEGSGTIVQIGDKVPKEMLNQRVAFFTDCHGKAKWSGAWAEYMPLHYMNTINIGDTPFPDACAMFINPMTAIGFVSESKKRGSGGIVHTAAASSLGKILVKLCLKQGVELVNIVRKPEQEKLLKDLGAKYVLNENSHSFMKDLTELATKLKISVCFEAVSGKLTGKILSAMPAKSTVFVYGTLSLSLIQDVNPKDLLFYEKKLEGFWLKNCILDPKLRQDGFEMIVADMKSGGALFKPLIAKEIKLEECTVYLQKYKEFATKGKTIFRPDLK